MDINVRELGIVISNKELKLKEPVIYVYDFSRLKNIIAECDDITKKIIIDSFKKSKNNTAYVESVGGTIEDNGEKIDFSTVSGPEIHTIESNDEIVEEDTQVESPKEEIRSDEDADKFDIDKILEEYPDKNKTHDDFDIDEIVKEYGSKSDKDASDKNYDLIDDILNNYSTDKKDKTTDDKEREESEPVIEEVVEDVSYDNPSEIVSQVEEATISNDYVVDPSQIVEKPLIERLKDINNDGPLFIDEERITDKSLNVRNAISLGKVNYKTLIFKETPVVNTRKNTILKMGSNLYNTFNDVCKKLKTNFCIKDGLNIAKDKILNAGTFLAEMPRDLSYKISNGALALRNNTLKAVDSISNKKSDLIDELKNIKESIENEYSVNEDSINVGRSL